MRIVVLILILSINSFSIAASEKIIATFKYIKGDVSLKRADNTIKIKKGDKIYNGDVISVYSKSLAVLDYQGISKIKIDPNTTITIKYKKRESESLTLGLSLGTVLMKYIRKNNNDKIFVKTKEASLGVRGTEFAVMASSKFNDAMFLVHEGKVLILNNKTKDFEYVTQNQALIATKDNRLSKPFLSYFSRNINWDFKSNRNGIPSVVKKKMFNEVKFKRNKILKKFKKKISKNILSSFFSYEENINSSGIILNQISSLMQEGKKKELTKILGELPPKDLGKALKALPSDDRNQLVENMPQEIVVSAINNVSAKIGYSILKELPTKDSISILKDIKSSKAKSILGEMPSQQSIEILSKLNVKKQTSIISKMPELKANKVIEKLDINIGKYHELKNNHMSGNKVKDKLSKLDKNKVKDRLNQLDNNKKNEIIKKIKEIKKNNNNKTSNKTIGN